MARRINRKCLHCATLDVEAAIGLHGPEGDRCWDPSICHRRRSHYRKRDDINAARRRIRRSNQKASGLTVHNPIELPPPANLLPVAAVLVLYRQRADAPVHAVAAEVWQGNQRIAAVQPIHCMGMKGDRVTAYIKEMLASLHHQFGISRFEDVIKELPVENCPIQPCPLKA
jgi:hypothetical protein